LQVSEIGLSEHICILLYNIVAQIIYNVCVTV
jgi:hypothetical protein